LIAVPSRPPPPPPCSVSVSITTSQLTYNGLPRNNPDGTYYPGDAFSVSLSIGSSHCTSISTSISGGSGINIACSSCTNTRVDVLPSASPGSYAVRAFVSGSGPGGPGSAATSMSITIADPMITVSVIPANLTDTDGYLMRNADGTYYINDAIALEYGLDYKFKDVRMGVIEPEVIRVHPYPYISDLDCLQESCTFVVPKTLATSEYSAQYSYATGIVVANATWQHGLGQKEFRFDVTLKNAGVYTNMRKSYTHTVSIVDYRPVFASTYPYLNLKDDAGSDMYERRLTVGVHYLGSVDASDGNIKPLRRAKVNHYTNNVTALVFGTNSTADMTRDAELVCLYTEHFRNSTETGTGMGLSSDVTVVSSTEQGKTAMIEREGYVKFVSRMMVYVPNTELWIRTANLTASQEFRSVNFGGKSSTELFSASYSYPDPRLTTNIITVNAIDENNYTIDRPVMITVDMRPLGTVSVCDYYERHALYSTGGDANIAAMARSDVYSCGDDNENGTVIKVTGTGTAYAFVNATSIIPLDEILLYRSMYPGGIDTMPPDLVLSMPYYLSIKVSVGGVTKDYSVPLYDSAGAYNVRVMANVGQNNALVAERAAGGASEVVYVQPADRELFGSIDAVKVGGKEASCQPLGGLLTCSANIPSEATILATNEWGGTAFAAVSAPVAAESNVGIATAVANDLSTVTMVLVAAPAAVVAAAVFRKWVSWTGDAFTQT